MQIFLPLIAILGFCFFTSRQTKHSFESLVLIICSNVLICLYIFSLLGLLKIAAEILLISGLFLFLKEIAVIFKNTEQKQVLLRCLSSYGFKFFIILTVIVWLISKSDFYSQFSFVDNFSHWGRITKLIAENHRLPYANEPIWFHNYPPGTALFNYFFLQFNNFNPGNAMFAQGVLIIAAMTRIFSATPKLIKTRSFIGISFVILSLIYFFGYGFRTLMTDAILGILFGAVVLGYLLDRQDTSFGAAICKALPIIIVLPLIKPLGILFSFVVIGVIASDALFASGTKKKYLKLAVILLLTGLPIASYLSWNHHVDTIGASKQFEFKVSKESLQTALSSNPTKRQKITIENFKRKVLTPYVESNYKPYFWLILCLGFLFLIRHLGSNYKPLVKMLPFLVLFLGMVGYLLTLLFLYLFVFSEFEGTRLASIDRYFNSYLLGILIVLFGLSLRQFFNSKSNKVITFVFITLCFFAAAPQLESLIKTYHVFKPNEKMSRTRLVINYAEFVSNKTPKDSNIYFLMRGESTDPRTVFNYGVMPRSTNIPCSSVGDAYGPQDFWSCNMSVTEFEQTLSNYNYLFIAYADDAFITKYASLFSTKVVNGGLYKVSNQGGDVYLKHISTFTGEIYVPKVYLSDKSK